MPASQTEHRNDLWSVRKYRFLDLTLGMCDSSGLEVGLDVFYSFQVFLMFYQVCQP